MARATFEYGALNELADEFVKMNDSLKEDIKDCATEIGNNLKNNTIEVLNNHKTREPKHGTYFADDVKMTTRANDKRASITVRGGKVTGPLWWTVDNGHVAQNGRFVPGIHFTDEAYGHTEVARPVDELIQRVLGENE